MLRVGSESSSAMHGRQEGSVRERAPLPHLEHPYLCFAVTVAAVSSRLRLVHKMRLIKMKISKIYRKIKSSRVMRSVLMLQS